jgi:hypothetical protein
MTYLCRYRGEEDVWLQFIRNLGAIEGYVVSTMVRPLYPQERPGTGWISLVARLEGHGKSRLPPASEPPDLPAPSEFLNRLQRSGIGNEYFLIRQIKL